MITVTMTHDQAGFIQRFTISGHAGYAQSGADIVCAGVSAVCFGTINAIHELLHVKLLVEMEEETGFLHCVVPADMKQNTHEKVQLLLQAMLVSLESIASEYGQYIKINKN